MTPAAFNTSLAKAAPPAGLSPALTALWWAGKDEWDKAHALVMSEDGPECAWVHAYLHRVEGDLDNARYCIARRGARRQRANLRMNGQRSPPLSSKRGSVAG
jgi:hypothetical protein